MEDVPEPGEGSVLVPLVEQLDLLPDDVLSLRARVLVEVHHEARVTHLFFTQCQRREGEESKEKEKASK